MKAVLRKDPNYIRFMLEEGKNTSWKKVSPDHPHGGLEDDGDVKKGVILWEGSDKERPEHLYRRLMVHVHDNLLKKDGKLKYDGESLKKNEEITPTVERLIVLRWLELMDPRLPQLVIRTFANDLLTHTLKDIQPQIASNIDSFLEEIQQSQANMLNIQASRVSANPRYLRWS